MIEQVLAALQARRPAGHLDALVGTVGVLGQGRGLHVEVDVIAHKEIQVAVLVVVQKRAARVPAQPVLLKPGFPGHFGKRPVPVVAEQRVLPVVADEKVVPAVVVVVAHAARLAPARAPQPRLQRHVGKRAVAVVLEQVADRLLALGKPLQPPAIDQKNVHPVVLVVVEEGRAAAGRLQQIFVAVLAAKDRLHVEPGFLGHVHKLDAQRRAGHRRRNSLGRRTCLCLVSLARTARGLLRRGSLLAGKPKRRPCQPQHLFQRQNQCGPR